MNSNKEIESNIFLVTGGAGFIGSAICDELVRLGAKKIRIIDNLSTGNIQNIKHLLNSSKIEFINEDLCNIETCQKACSGVDYVFHQAALGSVPRSINDPLSTHKSNVDAFVNLLIASRDNKVKRFVYASSSSVYGSDISIKKKEDIVGKLLSPYALSKATNEMYAEVFSKLYGIETVGLRYFNVFGPRQNIHGQYAAVIPRFITAFLKGEQPIIYGDGETTRDFTYVGNVVSANILAAFSDKIKCESPVLNIAFGQTTSLNSLFKTISNLLNKEMLPLYLSERPGDIKSSHADISNAKHLIGYNPMVSLDEGLNITIEWFKKSN
ncbi:MAG: SDR family oxidoreductase [Bacteroidota bacterium]|jgi:UDP-N-acetylglucosamine 4-epimerase